MAAIFASHQARIFYHSGRIIEEKTGRESPSYWLVCECRSHHGFEYWGIVARLDSLTQLQKLNGEKA
jgi:hypothetical protein